MVTTTVGLLATVSFLILAASPEITCISDTMHTDDIQIVNVRSTGNSEDIIPKDVGKQRDEEETTTGNKVQEHNSDADECVLKPDRNTEDKFRHMVYYYKYTFVYLILEFNQTDVNITGTNMVVDERHWVWTFAGKHGSVKFLSWPTEFNIWSMNLLTVFVKDNLPVNLSRKSGNCLNLVVGDMKTDEIISKALVSLVRPLIEMSNDFHEKYGPSYFCHKKRIYLNPQPFYNFCKYIVCPVEYIKQECCFYTHKATAILKREINCNHFRDFMFDDLWWIWPTIFAGILFSFFPLLLMRIGSGFTKKKAYVSDEAVPILNEVTDQRRIETDNYIFLDESYPVTIANTLSMPIDKIFSFTNSTSYKARMFRACLPFLSLSFIYIQITLDYFYLNGFVEAAVSKGALLGFRSMLAGYKASSNIFMPYIGGPFVALALYLLLTVPCIAAPESLSRVLSQGLLPRNQPGSYKLMPSLVTVEKYGSVLIHGKSGYGRIYNVLLGQFFMLLNKRFWFHIIKIQMVRWNDISSYKCKIILLPIYILFCIIEILLCVVFYNGIPIVSFSITIIRAYLIAITRLSLSFGEGIGTLLKMAIVSLMLIIMVTFQIYMSCTIFLDASIFITRVFIFTYTGIVLYPKFSYGYLIFAITVLYYFWDCVQNFAAKYNKLLKTTIKVCLSIQQDNQSEYLVITKSSYKGLRKDVFEHVIENICPRRKQMFCSLMKLFIILTIIGMSLDLLRKTDQFQELHIVMHVGTALFTCALPHILKTMCRGPDEKLQNKMFKTEVRDCVRDFLGYFSDDPDAVIVSES